jgi:hypothetical protein
MIRKTDQLADVFSMIADSADRRAAEACRFRGENESGERDSRIDSCVEECVEMIVGEGLAAPFMKLALAAIDDKPLKKLLGKMVTDEKRVTREDPGNPDDCNVYSFHKMFSTEEDRAWVWEGCTTAGIGCVDCKTVLADNVIEHLTPIRARRAELAERPDTVRDILRTGADRARDVAARTMAEVRDRIGLWS